MRVNKHGIPGIGVTGKKGKKGKYGNSFYFGTIDSFFSYIGNNTLKDISINYDDIDYDITYTEDELRLDPKYHEGDILYILSDDTQNAVVSYMVEITEDLTTCQKDYFLKNIKYNNPFLQKYGSTEHQLMFPVCLVNTDDDYLYNACKKHMQSHVRGIYQSTDKSVPTPKNVNIELESDLLDVSGKYDEIPSRFKSYNTRKEIINNGDEIHTYEYTKGSSYNLISCQTGNKKLTISGKPDSNLEISTTSGLNIDNLYIKNNNLGNIEAYNTLFPTELLFDNYGSCYTLTSKDYDVSTETFIIDVSSFFTDPTHTNFNDYHIGYVHKFWNYNEERNDTSLYAPNYIRGTITETTETKVRRIMLDEDGNYKRNWNSEEYRSIQDMYVKQALIYALDTSTLNDVSNLLNKSVSQKTFEEYSNIHGIIMTEEIPIYRTYDYIEHVNRKYQLRVYREKANDNSDGLYDINGNKLGQQDAYQFDTSFYSGCNIVYDTSNPKICLAIQDPVAQMYRHHEIIQWISLPNGMKYYSKQTNANYNYQTNKFDIDTSWIPEIKLPAFIDKRTLGNSHLFNLFFNDNKLTVNASTNGDDDIVKKIEIYENSSLIYGPAPISNNGIINNITVTTYTPDKGDSNENESLTDLLLGKYSDIAPKHVLYTIKYAVEDEETCSHIATYDRAIGGYTEYRKFPNISLHCYNDIESLEQLNNVNNGVLCNQFQFFVDLKINDFSQETWGKMADLYKNPVLKFNINFIKTSFKYANGNTEGANVTENQYKITWELIKPNIDIFNTSAKKLKDTNNIKQSEQSDIEVKSYAFNLQEATAGTYKIRVLIETKQPIPAYFKGHFEIPLNSVSINCDNKELRVDENIQTKVSSEELKFVIAPISYIAGYNQSTEKIRNKGTSKWYGSDEIVNIATKVYTNDIVYSEYTNGRKTNWNALKFKRRYFQDNIQVLSVNTLNINDIYSLIPESLYNSRTLADDGDDVYKTYLQFVYDSELFNPVFNINEYQFQYNNNSYLASEYGQFGNNTAIFVEQKSDIQVRSLSLIDSMKTWNNLYEQQFAYKSDNPYRGHLETYGNGYQYLPKTADTGQFLQDGIMSLSDIKTVNNDVLTEYDVLQIQSCEKPDKTDDYVPSVLFRSLLYNMKWTYPKYYSEQGLNLINMLPFSEASITGSNPEDTVMPYNLCYTIYPRIMFNDEEQTNIILMLRKPTVVNDTEVNGKPKNSLEAEDLCLPNVTSIKELTNPINVMD